MFWLKIYVPEVISKPEFAVYKLPQILFNKGIWFL